MGGSALTNEYFDASWYELQVLLNSGNHRHRDRIPVDWVYLIGRFQDLYRESRRPEPARLLVAVIKAMQSTDPRIGPEDRAQGWRPSQNVDPTIMVSERGRRSSNRFPATRSAPLQSRSLRRGWTRTCSIPWLDILRPVYRRNSYAPPASLGGISGGKVWEVAPLFMRPESIPNRVRQLQKWGTTYTDVAARFQYSDTSRSRTANKTPK